MQDERKTIRSALMKKILLPIALFFILGLVHYARADSNYIYKSPNKIDFVKLDKANKHEKTDGLLHPHTFTDDEVRSVLRSIRFNKKVLLSKDIEKAELFDEKNIEFLTPYLLEAFQKAGPEQVVVASYFTRHGQMLVQNDRLTVFRAFLKNDGLHFVFNKLYAKMLGDRTTMGADRAMQEARGLKVSLELQPGQNRIGWDPEEIVFDLNVFSGTEKVKQPKKKKKESDAVTAPEVQKMKSVRDRLKELEQMKKDELITDEEYKKKREGLIREL